MASQSAFTFSVDLGDAKRSTPPANARKPTSLFNLDNQTFVVKPTVREDGDDGLAFRPRHIEPSSAPRSPSPPPRRRDRVFVFGGPSTRRKTTASTDSRTQAPATSRTASAADPRGTTPSGAVDTPSTADTPSAADTPSSSRSPSPASLPSRLCDFESPADMEIPTGAKRPAADRLDDHTQPGRRSYGPSQPPSASVSGLATSGGGGGSGGSSSSSSSREPDEGTPLGGDSESEEEDNDGGDASDDNDDADADEDEDDDRLASDLLLLQHRDDVEELNEIRTTPLFTAAVRKHALSLAAAAAAADNGGIPDKPFTQYGLLAGDIASRPPAADPRLFYNVSAPASVFICGSQGSGKSHSLSCLLENCLVPSRANVLPRPLAGLVFHYDPFVADADGSPCEAAWLSTSRDVRVRVLCAPTNVRTMRKIYARFRHVRVEELRLRQADLNTKRMLDLMAVSAAAQGGHLPLYLHVVNRILRDLRVAQQRRGGAFDYAQFKRMLEAEDLTREQMGPLKQRLDTLESFMVEADAKAYDLSAAASAPAGGQRGGKKGGGGKGGSAGRPPPAAQAKKGPSPAEGSDWSVQPGQLTIVDLSCPCVTPEMACSLFHICLSLFLEQPARGVGKVVALDEAHKYMDGSAGCQALTDALLATIRLQRHLGTRVFISTQEPTVSPKLLDLCSVTLVHRFTSPDWLEALRKHLAGVSSSASLLRRVEEAAERARGEGRGGGNDGNSGGGGGGGGDYRGLRPVELAGEHPAAELFARIVDLRVGEALLFAPSAIVGIEKRSAAAKEGEVSMGNDETSGKDRSHRVNRSSPVSGGSGSRGNADTPIAGAGVVVKRLGNGVLKVRIRGRVTADGGRSIMAS